MPVEGPRDGGLTRVDQTSPGALELGLVKIVVIVTISRVSHIDTLEGRAFESRGRCVMAIWIDQGDIPLRNSVTPDIPHISVG